MAQQFPFDILVNSDHSLLIQFHDSSNKALSEYIYALSLAIPTLSLKGFVEAVSAYQSILVIFDVQQWNPDSAKTKLNDFIERFTPSNKLVTKSITIPVCYDPKVAPDLENFCSYQKISIKECIDLHSKNEYRVEVLGFLPGFLYLSGLDSKLQTPRKSNPSLSVPAGSIAIGGNQTGIYSTSSPGGWHIIGRTPIKTLNLQKKNPAIASPLDNINFIPISYQEFVEYES